jgi:hypothetical protein
MKYKLISKEDINLFNNEINSRLKKGWKLSGTTFTDKDNAYCQAMTLKTNKK